MTDRAITAFHGEWSFLSNFYPAVLTWEGITFPTSEHAFNAGKTLDPDVRQEIAAARTPNQAKLLGRKVQLRPLWDSTVRYQVMEDVLWAKFTCRPERVAALLRTGDAELVEGNTWHDQHWGDCCCVLPKCAAPGANHLGRLLMELRATLAQGVTERPTGPTMDAR